MLIDGYQELLWALRGVWLVQRQGKVQMLFAELSGFQCSVEDKIYISVTSHIDFDQWQWLLEVVSLPKEYF